MKLPRFIMIIIGLMFFIAIFAIPIQPLPARENEVSQLQQKILDLEGRIKKLEILLKQCDEYHKRETKNRYGWQNKKNWRKLKIGMRESKVKNILGEPVKIIRGVKTLWYYPNIYCGYVSFDEGGSLSGWNEP